MCTASGTNNFTTRRDLLCATKPKTLKKNVQQSCEVMQVADNHGEQVVRPLAFQTARWVRRLRPVGKVVTTLRP